MLDDEASVGYIAFLVEGEIAEIVTIERAGRNRRQRH